MTRVPGLGGNVYDFANGINSAGQVVGHSARSDGVGHAYLYSGGVTTDLGSLGGSGGYSDAYAINDNTQVTGVSNNTGRDRGFLWQNGTMIDIGDLNGGTGNTRAYAINNLGQIAGETWFNSSSVHHAMVWRNGIITDLGPGLAEGINDNGVVVGGNSGGLFVWDSVNGLRNTNALLDSSGTGWTLNGCRDINNLGQIVGWGMNPSGEIHGVVLSPLPEPSSFVLAGLGLLWLLGYAIRRRRYRIA